MPTIFVKKGFRYHFYSNEGDEPAHVHVTGNGGEMKVWLKPIYVENVYRVSPKDQRVILTNIKENIAILLEKWNEFASRKK